MEGGGGSAWRRRDALAGLTLGAVLGNDKELRPQQVSRTLLDIIREEEPNSRAYKNLIDHHHKKSWKSFKDRLRLKRAGAAWTSASIPASDVSSFHRSAVASSVNNTMSVEGGGEGNHRPQFGQLLRHHSVRVVDVGVDDEEETDHDHRCAEVPSRVGGDGSEQQAGGGRVQMLNRSLSRLGGDGLEQQAGGGRVQMLNRSLSRVVSLQTDLTQEDTLHIEQVPVSDVPVQNSRSMMMRRDSSRIPTPGQLDQSVPSVRLSEALAAEREQIQRVVSSTEAAGRRAREEEEEERGSDNDVEGREEEEGEEGGGQQQVRLSLMDLLEETDRQMGWSSYTGEDDDDEEDDEEVEQEEEGVNLVERNCCVCMVRHKGSAFIPCGHTFCRLCSRELWVNRGNCPLCNGFILEILDIF